MGAGSCSSLGHERLTSPLGGRVCRVLGGVVGRALGRVVLGGRGGAARGLDADDDEVTDRERGVDRFDLDEAAGCQARAHLDEGRGLRRGVPQLDAVLAAGPRGERRDRDREHVATGRAHGDAHAHVRPLEHADLLVRQVERDDRHGDAGPRPGPLGLADREDLARNLLAARKIDEHALALAQQRRVDRGGAALICRSAPVRP